MEFFHNGHTITVTENGYFKASVEGIDKIYPTLSGCKEWIDKELSVNVKNITINLPVCGFLRHSGDSAYTTNSRTQTARAVLTGINRTTGALQCKPTPKDYKWEFVLPDSDQNFELCQQYEAASRQSALLLRLLGALSFGRGIYGMIPTGAYQDKIDQLTKQYEESREKSSDSQAAILSLISPKK